jgi:hypothetical protein
MTEQPTTGDPERFRDDAWKKALAEAKPFKGPIPRLRKSQGSFVWMPR